MADRSKNRLRTHAAWAASSLGALSVMTTILAVPARAATPADTLVMAKNIDDMISLDPAECYELTGVEIDANIYDRIVRIDPHDSTKLVPGVAESWSVSPDGKTITFKLHPGLKFTSGNPVTAADAAFSLSHGIKLNKNPAFLISQLGWSRDNVDDLLKAVDDTTLAVTIVPNYSPSLVYSLLSSIVGSVVDKAVVMQQTFWPSGFWAAVDKNPFKFDPAEAKALLAEAGYPNGFDITLDASNSAPYINMAQAIQASMAQGGVRTA